MIISYDGTDFQGWQSQAHNKTIADNLNNTFFKIFNNKISVLGASRTDSGVHAYGQVAIFNSDINAECNQILRAWNQALPESIRIISLEICDENFHPHKNVIEKVYHYNLFLEPPLPFTARYGWLYDMIHQVDFNKFEEALKLYIGKHDFRSFCKLEDDKSTIRVVSDITVKKSSNMLQVIVKGPGFLHFQIRRMIGYALDVARRDDLDVSYIKELLNNPAPRQILLRAEAKGLFLKEIIYE